MAKRSKTATADLGLRVKETLRGQIERAAKAKGVSMNAEIVDRLEKSFEARDYLEKALQRYKEAEAERSEARIRAIRQAGFQIVREFDDDGNQTGVQVQVSAEHLLAEADGILRSGFLAADDVAKSSTQIMFERAVKNAIEEVLSRVAPQTLKREGEN